MDEISSENLTVITFIDKMTEDSISIVLGKGNHCIKVDHSLITEIKKWGQL